MVAHLTARSLDTTLLFHDWTEALALWRRLRKAFPEARALCLMPNHVHLVTDVDGAAERLRAVMSGYARWRAHRRGGEAACWGPVAVELLPDKVHLRRTTRYVLLNPCRGKLVADPLAWPLSIHRDLVGLGDPALRCRQPRAFHGYVSADPTVSLVGTPLPVLGGGSAPLGAVEDAVGAVLRMTPLEVREAPNARALFVRAAHVREGAADAIAAHLGVTKRRVNQLLHPPPTRARLEPELEAVLRAVGDPRFAPLLLPLRATTWSGWRLK